MWTKQKTLLRKPHQVLARPPYLENFTDVLEASLHPEAAAHYLVRPTNVPREGQLHQEEDDAARDRCERRNRVQAVVLFGDTKRTPKKWFGVRT